MRQLQRLAVLVLALSPALACGPTEGDHVEDYLAALADSDRAVCECEWDDELRLASYGSVDECVEDRAPGAAARGCVVGLFADEPTDHSGVLECRTRAIDERTACYDAVMCDMPGPRLDCLTAWREAYDACAQLPDDVADRLKDCLHMK